MNYTISIMSGLMIVKHEAFSSIITGSNTALVKSESVKYENTRLGKFDLVGTRVFFILKNGDPKPFKDYHDDLLENHFLGNLYVMKDTDEMKHLASLLMKMNNDIVIKRGSLTCPSETEHVPICTYSSKGSYEDIVIDVYSDREISSLSYGVKRNFAKKWRYTVPPDKIDFKDI